MELFCWRFSKASSNMNEFSLIIMPIKLITVKRKIYIVLLLQSPSHELLRVLCRQNKKRAPSKKASKPTAKVQNCG